ncbi:hypothetical protein VNN41_03340 [Lactococcus garvieae]|uniref:hypothetical protein n=1 Tax=Lactococcus garvieae TaxID=1363 RepID=UPI003249B618
MTKHLNTPFFDKISSYCKDNIYSFHALPLAFGHIFPKLALEEKFRQMYCQDFLKYENTLGSEWVDNPIFPDKCLAKSETQVAEIFDVDRSLFITSGTSNSNQIVIDALIEEGDRVLIAKDAHKSIHFSLESKNSNVKCVIPQFIDNQSGRQYINFEKMLEDFKREHESGKIYKAVVINGSSYEGVIYNLPVIAKCLAEINPKLTIIVDEAWMAFAKFHSTFSEQSILSIAHSLKLKYPELTIVCTQSLHKSLPSMRQASIIHIVGNDEAINKINIFKFKIHTTSPSYSILSSIELSLSEMSINGEKLISEALENALDMEYFIGKLKTLSINYERQQSYWMIDPLKLSVNFSFTGKNVSEVKKILKKNKVFVNRFTQESFLLNFHIGVTNEAIKKLKLALLELENNTPTIEVENISDEYVIPYPPGTPILVPGDKISKSLEQEILRLENSGIRVIHVKEAKFLHDIEQTKSI